VFAIYNSFTELYREKLEYPISSADMSDSGAYVIVTRSQKHTSVIRVYTNQNTLDMEYSKNDHVIDAAISADGRYLAVLSMSVSG
jgi:tricorn protease-like protein